MKLLNVRLKDLFDKWVKPETATVKEISELLILEFLRMVGPELEVWIRERDPKSAEEAARLAEVFMSARSGSRRTAFSRDNNFTSPGKSDGGERGGHSQVRPHSSTRQFSSSKPNTSRKSFSGSRQDTRCYQCNDIGHTQYTCPATKQSKPSLLCSVPRLTHPAPVKEEALTTPALVNGQREEALLDSGCFQSAVLPSLVPRELWSEVTSNICCVHEDKKTYPTAEVYLTVGGQTYILTVALVPTLLYSAVLGHDVLTLLDLIQQARQEKRLIREGHVDSMVQAPVQEAQQNQPNPQPAATACNIVTTRAQKAESTLKELPFFHTEFELGPVRQRKSKAQRRREKLLAAARDQCEGAAQPSQPLDFQIPSNIAALQQADPTLKQWFGRVSEVEGVSQGKPNCLADATYVIKNGILYKHQGKVEALALPQNLTRKVMELGHSIPWAGHLAFQKTLSRVGSRFVWPGMYTCVKNFCASCETCQITSPRGVVHAQLQPLPVIDTPFDRIGMDVVWPLERSACGNQYILVICDYATRYPEALPLKSVKARQVANCLLQLFSRVGIPKEILTNCGTNFLSKLLRQVYQLLGVKGIKTTPYHPQTGGLVERFNQTLKNMLQKFVSNTGSDCDQWLPYLLFAYREVPQAST